MSNSSLVTYTNLSPSANHYGARTHSIDRITPHCVVGQCTVESLGNLFANPNRGATSTYGIGYDGRVGLYCIESNAPGTSSSYANDNRAVTIEIASDTTHPYWITDKAYATAIQLMADICKRNGKNKLVYIADKNTALAYSQASNEMLITLHRWFSSTICPGQYIIDHLPDMVKKVNEILGGSAKRTLREEAQYMIDNNINGKARYNQCVEDGFHYEDVQNEIDRMLAKDKSDILTAMIACLPTIQNGSTGDAVKVLQTELKYMGYYDGNIDGSFGSMTETALKGFQTNISKVYGSFGVDGVCGKKTWTKIFM